MDVNCRQFSATHSEILPNESPCQINLTFLLKVYGICCMEYNFLAYPQIKQKDTKIMCI